jgi:lipopolysaccharide/colanic/teichoic acid biosynthesis glycosyltransferase
MIVFTVIVISMFTYTDLYNFAVFLNRYRYIYRTTKGIVLSFIAYLVFSWLTKSYHPQHTLFPIVLFFIFSSLTYFSRIVLLPIFCIICPRKDVILFAPEGEYKEIENWIKNHRESNLNIKEIITNEEDLIEYVEKGIPAILSTVTGNWDRLLKLIFNFKKKSLLLVYSPLLSGIGEVDYWPYINEVPLVPFRWSQDGKKYILIKRIIDIFGAIVAIIIFSPLMMISAILIKFTSKGPVIFTQERYCKNNKKFSMLKFRSMLTTNDHKVHREFVKELINGNNCDKKVYKLIDDPRITPIGNILRKTSLDEFPQFFNVLKGELSLVGPRPPIEYEIKEYSKWQKERLSVNQGITGMWQIFGRSQLPFDKSCFLDIYYAENQSIWLDIHLLALTLPTIVFGKGAY